MRNALSIAAGAWSDTSVPKTELISRLRLIRPQRDGHRQHQLQHAAHPLVAPVQAQGQAPPGRATRAGSRNCTTVPARMPIA